LFCCGAESSSLPEQFKVRSDKVIKGNNRIFFISEIV